LQKINKKYLNKSYFTDVISFKHNHESVFHENQDSLVFGDVFISIDRVKENKKLYNTIFAKELQRVMIHGVLHLMGHKDSTKKEKMLMREKEYIYINLL
jgi:rRNA maturation RNase YbeY